MGLNKWVLGLLLAPCIALAGPFQDPALQRAYELGRLDDLARLSEPQDNAERLAAQTFARALPNDAAALGQALQAADRCVERYAQEWICHWAQGHALGVKALRGGWMKGLGVLPQLRASLERALALKPDSFDARSRLQQFYLLVPALVGGGADRARTLESAVGLTPVQRRLLQARLAVKENRLDEAERALEGLHRTAERVFLNEVMDAWSLLLHHWLKNDAHGAARARLAPLLRDLPELAWPAYALGRIEADAKQHEEAARLYQTALGLSGASELPLDHRLGLSLEALGQSERARQHLERFLRNPQATPNALEDARKHLQRLAAEGG